MINKKKIKLSSDKKFTIQEYIKYLKILASKEKRFTKFKEK